MGEGGWGWGWGGEQLKGACEGAEGFCPILLETFEAWFMDSPFSAPMLTEEFEPWAIPEEWPSLFMEDFEDWFMGNPFDAPVFVEDFENGGW